MSFVMVTVFAWPICAEPDEPPEPWVTDEDRAIARGLTDTLTPQQRDRWLISLVKVLGWTPYVKPKKPRTVDQAPTPLAPLRAAINQGKSREHSRRDWEAMLEQPIDEVRAQLGICSPPIYEQLRSSAAPPLAA